MKTSFFKLGLWVFTSASVILKAVSASAAGVAVYFHDPKEVFISPGLSFFTTLRTSSSESAVGAFSVLLKYDTNALQIQQVVPASGSPFGTNIFPDSASFQSGSTRIVGFQASDSAPTSISGNPVCYVVWRTIGNANRQVEVTNVVEKHVNAVWGTDYVESSPIKLTLDSTDSDGDGVPDWWERLYFGSPTAADPNADPDGDGYSNLQEFRAGTSPIDSAQLLRITVMDLVGADARIGFRTLLTRTYQVEWSENLIHNSWTALGDVVQGSGNIETRTDFGVLVRPLRFYRVRVLP